MEADSQNGKDQEVVHLDTIHIPGILEEVAYTDNDSKRVRRKLDGWLMPVLMITYALQYWDKSLTGQAVQFNFAADLGLIKVIGKTSSGAAIISTRKLANISLIFYIGYLVMAYPAVYLTQRFPTAKVCAVAIFGWATIIMATPACSTYAGIMVNRFFLGIMEAFIAPTFVVYITFWWTRQEQSLRNGLWWGMNGVALMITPLISWGVGHINGTFGKSTWKYMYLVAGSTTCIWSMIVLIVLPDDPQTAKWLNERDRAIVIARTKENNAGSVNRYFKKYQLLEGLRDFNMWSNAFIILSAGIPNAVFSSFSTLIIAGFGFTAFNSLLLLMPLGFTAALSVFVSGYIARRWDGLRYILIAVNSFIALAGSFMCWLGPREQPKTLYAGIVLMTFTVGASAVSVAMVSSNVSGHTKKATISGGSFIGYCIGNIVGPLCFSSTPGPVYAGGFISCVVVFVCDILISALGFWWLRKENARRDREYGTPGIDNALEDLTDRENTDFRYVV